MAAAAQRPSVEESARAFRFPWRRTLRQTPGDRKRRGSGFVDSLASASSTGESIAKPDRFRSGERARLACRVWRRAEHGLDSATANTVSFAKTRPPEGVAVRRGGEHRNENDPSVTQACRVASRRELDSVGVDGRACERLAKPVERARGEEPKRRTAGWSPVVAPMVGDGMAGSRTRDNQGDPPGSSGVHACSARRAARRESERP